MSADEHQRRGPLAGCLAIGLLLSLPTYFLSIGPFIWLVNHGYLPRELGVVYAPLGVLVTNIPAVEWLFRWYEQFWQ